MPIYRIMFEHTEKSYYVVDVEAASSTEARLIFEADPFGTLEESNNDQDAYDVEGLRLDITSVSLCRDGISNEDNE